MVASNDGTWIHFDYVPEEAEIRTGAADVTGKICVIGAKLNEEALEKLEKAEFLTNEKRWKRRYPQCEIIQSHTDHNQFLITQESKDMVVDYFLNNI